MHRQGRPALHGVERWRCPRWCRIPAAEQRQALLFCLAFLLLSVGWQSYRELGSPAGAGLKEQGELGSSWIEVRAARWEAGKRTLVRSRRIRDRATVLRPGWAEAPGLSCSCSTLHPSSSGREPGVRVASSTPLAEPYPALQAAADGLSRPVPAREAAAPLQGASCTSFKNHIPTGALAALPTKQPSVEDCCAACRTQLSPGCNAFVYCAQQVRGRAQRAGQRALGTPCTARVGSDKPANKLGSRPARSQHVLRAACARDLRRAGGSSSAVKPPQPALCRPALQGGCYSSSPVVAGNMTTLPYQGCALLYQGLSDARTGRPLLAIRMQGFMGGAVAAACTGASGRAGRVGARLCRAGCAKQCTRWSGQRPETREVSPPVGPSLPPSLNSPRPPAARRRAHHRQCTAR